MKLFQLVPPNVAVALEAFSFALLRLENTNWGQFTRLSSHVDQFRNVVGSWAALLSCFLCAANNKTITTTMMGRFGVLQIENSPWCRLIAFPHPTVVVSLCLLSLQTSRRLRSWWNSLRVWHGKERTWSWRAGLKANPSKTQTDTQTQVLPRQDRTLVSVFKPSWLWFIVYSRTFTVKSIQKGNTSAGPPTVQDIAKIFCVQMLTLAQQLDH